MTTAILIWIWAAFLIGVGLRVADRIEHAIKGPGEVTSVAAYFKAQPFRLALRLAAGAVIFQVAIETGEVTTKLAALLAGYGIDTALDSLLERGARNGKNGNGKNGTAQPVGAPA